MIDTHSHIQFKIFDRNRDQVIADAKKAGVEKVIAVGTNLETSKRAVEIANQYPEVFASVGIHPHHVFGFLEESSVISRQLSGIKELLNNSRVIAVGETGMDKHIYKSTKYESCLISNEFIELQKVFFTEQIKLAVKYKKALIIHNREAVSETLEVLEKNLAEKLEERSVFHFCEPDEKLLDFALSHHIFIGVDADVLTDKKKQDFVKKIPLELLVLETDSPFISPTPVGILEILECLSRLLQINQRTLKDFTLKNSTQLFKL